MPSKLLEVKRRSRDENESQNLKLENCPLGHIMLLGGVLSSGNSNHSEDQGSSGLPHPWFLLWMGQS